MRVTIEQYVGCPPIKTYPLDLLKDIPHENDVHKLTLHYCTYHHEKLKGDLSSLNLPGESRQSLDIVLHSLENFIDVYHNLGSTTYGFIDLL